MNYTENYHLPQWEETDRIMRTDFNDAMANIEGGLTDLGTSWVIGTYSGWGSGNAHKITTGFRPRMLLIHAVIPVSASFVEHRSISYFFLSAPKPDERIVIYEDDGFTVIGDNNLYPQVNINARYYVYIAFR